MLKRYGLIFIIISGWVSFALAQSGSELDLERIVITKENVHLSRSYCVKSSDLEELPIDSPIEALNTLPIDLQSRSPKAAIQADFSLRGSNFQEVLVLLDGQRINDPQTGHHNADIPITKEDMERVDLLPGVSSAVFGPDSIGGAVNFILKKPDRRKIVFESSGGQNKTWSGLFSASDKIGSLGARLSVENQESAGFYTDTDFKKFTAHFDSCVDVQDGEYNLSFGYQEKEFGAYDFYTPASGYQSKEWTKTYLLDTGANLEKGGLLIKPNFLWRRHYDKFMLDKTLIRSRYLNHTRTDMFTPNLYLQKDVSFLGKVGLGLEYGEELINGVYLGKHKRNHKSIFIDDAKDFSNKLSFGTSFRADNFSNSENVFTGSLSLKYKLTPEMAMRSGVSRSTRIPSFTELYYSDPTTVGNSALSNEKSMNYQLGFDYKLDKLSFGSAVFYRREKDFIDWVKSSSTQAQWQAQNIDKNESIGIENSFRFEINETLTLDSNYTFVNNRNSKQGYTYKYGPNYAKHILNSEFMIKLPFGTQSIGFTYKKKAVRDGWFLLNARLNYNLNKHSSLFLNATNLCNVGYQEIEGIPSPGRWVEGGFRLEW
jgi:iron complex outermembrane receptor protein